MTNSLTIFGGLVIAVIGAYLWWLCRGDFLTVFRGCIGVTLVFTGLLAFFIGWSEWKASREFESAVPSPGSSPATSTPAESATPTAAAEPAQESGEAKTE